MQKQGDHMSSNERELLYERISFFQSVVEFTVVFVVWGYCNSMFLSISTIICLDGTNCYHEVLSTSLLPLSCQIFLLLAETDSHSLTKG